MLQLHLLLLGVFFLHNIPMVNSIICYTCSDCPEPFTSNYPYVTLTNNTNFLAQCVKTIVDLGNGNRLISKGSVFNCPTQPTTSSDIQLFCCGSDYCNSSVQFGPSILLLFFIFIRNIFMNIQY